MRHEIEVERQLVGGQPLEQRQNVASLRGGDEIVRVLDARLDRLAGEQPADRVVLEPGGKLIFGNWRVNRQGE
jgi:hypothetical protein